ncbi:hypothetical protein C8Q74DRAFT_1372214 [Fomes fomentarius]|nr:hypothetical protein C8Q74DRAFT_1372214 [Fomes fomentarius]
MPLFGKHNKTHDTTGTHDRHDAKYDAQPDTGLLPNQPVGGQNTSGVHTGTQNAYGYPQGTTGQYAAGGPGPGPGPGLGGGTAGQNQQVPPVSHINTSTGHQGGGGSRLVGKTERAVGTLVGSQALKEKGIQKEQEASAFTQQSAEIAEAERLEKEALMRRERAVAHGAHPDNRHLGGLQNANTLDDVAGTGTHGTTGGGQYGSGHGY